LCAQNSLVVKKSLWFVLYPEKGKKIEEEKEDKA
jgi:hypothetical protein